MEDFAAEPQGPSAKRRCSSILRAPNIERRLSSKAVSFSDRCFFKNLDGSCEISRLFLQEEMELTLLDVVEPCADNSGRFGDSDMDISCSASQQDHMSSTRSSSGSSCTVQNMSNVSMASAVSMGSAISMGSITKTNNTTTNNSISNNSSSSTTSTTTTNNNNNTDNNSVASFNETSYGAFDATDISSFNATTVDASFNETLYGAFNASNLCSSTDTINQNIEALNDCIKDVEKASAENRRRLDEEIENLFRYYRHIVAKENRYEFAISIFGLRHSLWLIIKVDPDTYPNEKLNLKFAVHKEDRHLYPFYEFAESVRRTTQEGRPLYLTRFIINAQRFRRFLRIASNKTKSKLKN